MREKWGVYKFALAAVLLSSSSSVALAGGVQAPAEPVQIERSSYSVDFSVPRYKLTPLATFKLQAKILAKKRYRFDNKAELAPYDLALGWGSMSDEAIVKNIEFGQSDRWYHWQASNLPISAREVSFSSANMHMIPANDTVKGNIARAQIGQIIELEGFLVDVQADAGWHWNSSMIRTDTGEGACEVVLVKKFTVLHY